MKNKLSLKFMLPSVIVVVLGVSLFGWIMDRTMESEVSSRANMEAADELDGLVESLEIVNGLSSQAVRTAMAFLQREGEHIGAADINGTSSIQGQTVPSLRLGGSSQVGDFSLVDRVKLLTGSTATLFVKRGDGFVRVSTKVLKPDGSRAVGTLLDPNGRTFAAIREAQSFYGVVDILGTPYMTGYEPMRDGAARTIGVWYVGYPLTAIAGLGKHISGTKILDNGFVAMVQGDGSVISRSEGVRDEDVRARLKGDDAANWITLSKPFGEWGYLLIAAYPRVDVAGRLHRLQVLVMVCVLVMCF